RAAELFDLLNPVRHAASPAGVERYKVEPYVVSADIYGVPPHTGPGGWAWCTGSASWLYRGRLEASPGFRLRGTPLALGPCVPPDWPRYEIIYRLRSATYHVVVENSGGSGRGVRSLSVDGRPVSEGVVELVDDGRQHKVLIALRT